MNVPEPRLLKVAAQKDSKFIMASCGSKHTLALDTSGKLWFFGLKSSIGISSKDDKQLVPMLLEAPGPLKKENFKFIASGDDFNLAVSTTGQGYGLGRNLPSNKISDSCKNELAYFEPIKLEK